MLRNESQILHHLKIGRWIGPIVSCTGILVFVGWWFDIATLKQVLPDLVAMNPVTALTFLIAGISLFALYGKTSFERRALVRYLRLTCALFVKTVGANKL